MHKMRFGDIFLYEDDNNLHFIRDGVIIRSSNRELVGRRASIGNSKEEIVSMRHPTFGNNTPITLSKEFSEIRIEFLDIYTENVGLASCIALKGKSMSREHLWGKYLGKPAPFPVNYCGPLLKDINCIPNTADIVAGFPRLDSEFDPTTEPIRHSRKVYITDNFVYKVGNVSQQRTELFYSLWSSNPFFVPVISAFYYRDELVLVQPRIRGEENLAANPGRMFRNLMGDDFCFDLPNIGLTFYDGVVLNSNSSNIIIDSSGIPWIFDLGGLLFRNEFHNLQFDWQGSIQLNKISSVS